MRALARRFRQDRREDVRRAGAVLHRRPRIADHRPVKRVAHPVRAGHPGAVFPPLVDSSPDRIVSRCSMVIACLRGSGSFATRKPADDRLVDTRNQLALDGDADERRDDALRRGLDVRQPRRTVSFRVVLEGQLAAVADEQAVQTRQRRRGCARGGGVLLRTALDDDGRRDPCGKCRNPARISFIVAEDVREKARLPPRQQVLPQPDFDFRRATAQGDPSPVR